MSERVNRFGGTIYTRWLFFFYCRQSIISFVFRLCITVKIEVKVKNKVQLKVKVKINLQFASACS